MTNETIIPQVNALATDRNRKQTKRICELAGYAVADLSGKRPPLSSSERAYAYRDEDDGGQATIALPNGSLTPDQVWGMLKAEGCHWAPHHQTKELADKGILAIAGVWVQDVVSQDDQGRRCHNFRELVHDFPHDLTAAMDALIKALEEKG